MGILPCWTSFGKTSMKPSSIDDPVARYSPRTGRRQKASSADTATRPRSDQRRRPPLTNGIDTARSVGVEASSTGGVARSVKRRDGSQCNAQVGVYRRSDASRRAGVGWSRHAHDDLQRYVDDLIAHGVRRVHTLAWRDLDDPDAGGSEVHADEFMRRWAAAGLEVLHRTSSARGLPATAHRNGYEVVRRGSRYSVFPRTIAAEVTAPDGALRRTGRDLERRAVVLAGLVSAAAHHVPAPCARPDVGPDPSRAVGSARSGSRESTGTALLPSHADGHPVRCHPGRADRAGIPTRTRHGGPQRHRPPVPPRR